LKDRVGGGVSPAASHTTGHTVPYHGGSCWGFDPLAIPTFVL